MSADKIDDGGAVLQAARAAGMHVDCGIWTGTTAQIHAFVEAVSRVALRDHFAAKAMQGLLAEQGPYFDDATSGVHGYEDVMTVDQLAEYAYAQADAMLKARSA